MPGKSRLTSCLLRKSVKTNTMSGVTATRSLILRKHGRKSRHRHLATLWLKCSKTDSNQINNYGKKALSHEFLPTAKGFVYNMDLLVAQPPVNHSLTLKPPDYKNNASHAAVINLLSKDFLKCRKPAQTLDS